MYKKINPFHYRVAWLAGDRDAEGRWLEEEGEGDEGGRWLEGVEWLTEGGGGGGRVEPIWGLTSLKAPEGGEVTEGNIGWEEEE